jgi:hypothetical protein
MQIKRNKQQMEDEQMYNDGFERIRNEIKTYRVIQA